MTQSFILVTIQNIRKTTPLSPAKIVFFERLSEILPDQTEPNIETNNGEEVDLYWEDKLIISVTKEDNVFVTSFIEDDHQYEFFETIEEKTYSHIFSQYQLWFCEEKSTL